MQNDLISRSALLELLKSGAIEFEVPMPESHVDTVKRVLEALYEKLEKTIKEQPTAYDVEKVIDEMNKYPHGYLNVETIYDLTEIVRNGGKE
jgi:hypothetical protein